MNNLGMSKWTNFLKSSKSQSSVWKNDYEDIKEFGSDFAVDSRGEISTNWTPDFSSQAQHI